MCIRIAAAYNDFLHRTATQTITRRTPTYKTYAGGTVLFVLPRSGLVHAAEDVCQGLAQMLHDKCPFFVHALYLCSHAHAASSLLASRQMDSGMCKLYSCASQPNVFPQRLTATPNMTRSICWNAASWNRSLPCTLRHVVSNIAYTHDAAHTMYIRRHVPRERSIREHATGFARASNACDKSHACKGFRRAGIHHRHSRQLKA